MRSKISNSLEAEMFVVALDLTLNSTTSTAIVTSWGVTILLLKGRGGIRYSAKSYLCYTTKQSGERLVLTGFWN